MRDTKNIWFDGFHLHVLPVFTWTSDIGNLWSICLGDNILSLVANSNGSEHSIPGHPVPSMGYTGNITVLKSLRTILLPS